MLHAYIDGFGVELMANSDNVLRGGLTSKHVDVDELMGVLDFSPHKPEILKPQFTGSTAYGRYITPCREFSLVTMSSKGEKQTFPQKGPAIIIVTEGSVTIKAGEREELVIQKGESAFISAEATGITFTGAYTLYAAALP
ncbi:hypothetical protein FACS189462_1950 [Spirochaetia bacterium]|nr:hypothetical protein FACS189462_1950 [Spirochaetia bacterium]